ncbi:MAG: trimethylamine methyltransferase family protein [Desulfobacterales bacterium]|jgi:trimethylamine--corrinoid protein Co-methyltransferase
MDRRSNYYEVLIPEDVKKIHLTALRIAEEIGLCMPFKEALELYDAAGAQVDFDKKTVRIPSSLIENSLKKIPSRFTFHARNPKYSLDMNSLDTYFSGPNCALNVIDAGGKRRAAVAQDGIDFSRLTDALVHYDISTVGVYPASMAPGVLEAWAFITSLIHSNKPVLGCSFDGQCARDHITIAEIVADACDMSKGQLPIMVVCNTKSPLANSAEELEALSEYAHRGIALMISPEVMAGATGPVSIAGTLTQAVAEFLAHATYAQLINPGNPVMFGCVCSAFDMRTTILPYGAPEGDLLSMAIAQMARYYGIPSRGTGGASDANCLGMQAGVESLISNLLCLLGGITYVNHAGGELENTLAASYEKTVVDHEIIAMAKRVAEGISVNNDTLAFEEIKAVGPRGDFLSSDHTFNYFRTEHFIPTILDRDKYDIWEAAGGLTAEEKSQDLISDILRNHEQEVPMPDEAVQELEAFLDSKKKAAGM